MISLDDLNILCQEQTRDLIDQNIEREHTAVALDKSLCPSHRALVAGQVKYLQRSRLKLPSYYAARCIIPDRAFEQSSSEATAECKRMEGESVLELCCGLGVDTFALSKRFRRVVTLERDEVLAEVARENFRRLGSENIEVVCCSAEEFLAKCEERFDWLYADPDRRDQFGRKCVILEDCSPNMIALRGDVESVASRFAIKCSPLFDVDEAFRLYPGARVEVVSLAGECKEVVIYVGEDGGEAIGAVAVGRGEVWLAREDIHSQPNSQSKPQSKPQLDIESIDRYRYLIIPDVSLQKGRIACRVLSELCDIWSDNGYGLAQEPMEHPLARVERIGWIGEYDPRRCRKMLAERGIKGAEILKKEFAQSLDRVTKQLKIKEGGSGRVALTKIEGREIMVILERQ